MELYIRIGGTWKRPRRDIRCCNKRLRDKCGIPAERLICQQNKTHQFV